MSAECLRAAAASRESTVSGRPPAFARSALTMTRTAVSAGRLATLGGLTAFGFFLPAGGAGGVVAAAVGAGAVGVGSATAFSDGGAAGLTLPAGPLFAGTP